jgi:hypothetical protein
MNTMFETKFRSYMQNVSRQRQLELQQVAQNPSLPPLLSSIGSTVGLHMWYPVNDITGDTLCRIHILLSKVGNKTKEVAIGLAMPGHVFHNNPIPAEYAKVLVREITDMSYIDYPLDHVMPEVVKELGEAVNQFILCNRCEIALDWADVTTEPAYITIKTNGNTKGQGSSATNVSSAGSKVQGSFVSIVSKGKQSFSTTNVTYQGYAPAAFSYDQSTTGTRSTTIISLQHNPPGTRPLQAKYSFRPNEHVL